MGQTPIETFRELLARPRRIAITMHLKPDGDALGSSLGLYHYLVKKGHRASVISPTDYPDFLKWMPGNEAVVVGPDDPEKARWDFESADLIFCLDFNELSRLGEFEKAVQDSEAETVMIDHHLEPVGFETYRYWDDTASSTAELIHRWIVEMGDASLLDADIAAPLYAGVMTDTGSFRFTNTSPAVHRMVADLLEAGADPHAIHEQIFANSTLDRVRLTGHVLSNCLTVLPELRTAYLRLDKEVFRQFNVRTGDTEGLVNYALSIKGIDLGIMMSAQDDMVKFSFRSRNEVSASELAGHFNGGGHFYAAGGRIKADMDTAEKQLLETLKDFMAGS
ncbi:MAG: bifunctional oligoribonuclease/PAP phosphatase NrnA [Bacteroidetes bacterium]|nr:MAG: bifunctional oligoribonuclease/PAP phosphatase NrnA [Bacteroidota bacterium]